MMSSTYSTKSMVFLWKIPSGKSFNWLFCKYLPTNNHNQCQLHDEKKMKECVLVNSILDIEYHGTENMNNEK